MWNHRQLDDQIQAQIELIIKERVADYGYGTRREDQTAVIDSSGLFGPVVHLDLRVMHEQTIAECVEAWRSHATLERQAGESFGDVIAAIEHFLNSDVAAGGGGKMATLKSPTPRISGSLNSNENRSYQAGDFTGLAKDYSQHRPDYCPSVL